jgi:ERCC4-type nuclease
VDIVKAMNAGSLEASDPTTTSSSSSTALASDILASETRLAAQEILLSLPGVNIHNFRIIMSSVTSLSELSRMEESDLSTLIGAVNAKKLYVFFKQRIAL